MSESRQEHPSALTPGPAAAGKERFARMLDIFSRAVAVEPAERAAILSEVSDAELRRDVELMLAEDEGTANAKLRTGSGSGSGMIEGLASTSDPLKNLPKISGQYRLIRQLGEGGMGVVYLAEQALPRRLVALKAVRAGLTSKQVLERFERETHILGRLQDPGIAQIYEAGILEDDTSGRAYIVMEYVDGPTLTKYAEQKQLARRERLELMIRVCAAVHHAHLKRVIHRDLKPANVLVNSEGNPKILDFGIASLESDNDATLTRDGQLLGTPAYMSPEQVRGEDVDTRADVYALGVMLFELLTKSLPHDLTGLSLVAALDKVRNHPPRRAIWLDSTLEMDLDAIVSMALATDPSARYQSADALGSDLRRHLDGESIAARQETGLTTMTRLVKRHRLATAGGVLAMLGLVFSAVIFGQLSRRNALLAGESEAARMRIASQADELKRALYVSRIGNAEAALASGDTVKARTRLEQCDPESRGWEWRHLWRAVDQSLQNIVVPEGASVVAMNDTGTRAVVHRLNQAWQTVDIAAAKLGVEHGVGTDVVEASLSPDENWVVSRTRRGGVELLDLSGRTPAKAIEFGLLIEKEYLGVSRVMWLDQGREFLCVAPNGKGFVFDVGKEGPVRTLESRPTMAYDARKRPGRDEWMCTFEDGCVQLRDARDGTLLMEKTGLPMLPVSIGFSPDGMRAAIGCFNGKVLFWDLATNELTEQKGHSSSVRCTVFSPDGQRVASGGRDRVLKVWDFKSGALLSTQTGEQVRVTAIAWRDNYTIVTAGDGGPIRIFNADAEPIVPTFKASDDVTTGSDTWNNLTALSLRNGEIVLFDHTQWRQKSKTASPRLLQTRFTSNGLLVVSSEIGTLRLYDPEQDLRLVGECHDLEGEGAFLFSSSDRSKFAAVQVKKGITLIDPVAMKAVKSVQCENVAWCDVLNDGSFLVGTAHPSRCQMLTPAPGRTPWSVELATEVLSAAVSSDQKRVAIALKDRTIQIYDADTGAIVRSFATGSLNVEAMQFFDHDSRLAGGGQDQSVRIWAVNDGLELATLSGHRSYLAGLMACDEGESLITIDVAGTLRKWKSNTVFKK